MKTVYIHGDSTRFSNYQRAVEQSGGQVRFGGDPTVCSALLLPGGGDLEPWRYGQENTASCHLEPERDAAEFALLEQFTALRKPVLGICRGLQSINVFFGGTLLQDISNHSAIGCQDRLHPVKTLSSPLRAICGEQCIVNSAHHQAIDRLGAGLESVQWATDGIIEAIAHRSLPVFALQWHPERLSSPTGTALFHWFLSCLK